MSATYGKQVAVVFRCLSPSLSTHMPANLHNVRTHLCTNTNTCTHMPLPPQRQRQVLELGKGLSATSVEVGSSKE
jgi:hypothetical protein